MNKVLFYKAGIIVTLVFVLTGAFFKIMHYPNGAIILSLGLISSLVYIILGLVDVFSDKEMNLQVRFMWLIGFIFISWIAGMLYYPHFKKRNQK
ncbi:MAG: hypothetical protein AB9846_01725 [Tenuifilaceae bacterium]